MQFERAHLINDVCVIKRPPTPLSYHHSYVNAYARVQRQVCDDTNDILFVMWTNIVYYGPNCFCTLLYAHTRATIKSERGSFILPLNVFPIDHCSKDVINNLKA